MLKINEIINGHLCSLEVSFKCTNTKNSLALGEITTIELELLIRTLETELLSRMQGND